MPAAVQDEIRRLQQRLVDVEAELEACKDRQKWTDSALADQRHARQVLEASVSWTYPDTVIRIRDIVRAAVPPEAAVLVVSRGDDELLRLDGRRAWHFPGDDSGRYAGHYPADSAGAILKLGEGMARGAQYLVFPNTAFWWLEHYREFGEWLDRCHLRVWRDDRCVIYRLSCQPGFAAEPPSGGPPLLVPGTPRLAQSPAALPDIFCFPIIDWDYRFQRPQQLMRQFAAAGHRVFYLSHDFRSLGAPYVLRPLAMNLAEVSLRACRFKLRDGLLDEDSRRALAESVSALQADHAFGAPVAIVQSAFWWPIVRQAASAAPCLVVYDCMDHHAGFANSNPVLLAQERDLTAGADLVVASSRALERAVRPLNRQVLLLPNACDYKHFAAIPPSARTERPTIGYYGAIAEWFDGELVAQLAERRGDWNFVLVGSTVGGDIKRLWNLPNVSLPGEKPYPEIPAWLAGFDVAILPFKRTPLTEATNPVKAYEIMASGRPLVSVPLPEMLPLTPLCRLASSPEEFEREIQAELEHPGGEMASRRRAFAKENTWEKRFETLAGAIRRTRGQWLKSRPAADSRPAQQPAQPSLNLAL